MRKHFLNGAFSGFTKSAVNDSSNYNAAFKKNFVIILIKTLQFSSDLNVSFENIPYQDFNETYNCNF